MEFLRRPWYLVPIIENQGNSVGFFWILGILFYFSSIVILSYCGYNPSGVTVLRRKSISVAPKGHLCIVSFSPACMHSKVALKFWMRLSASFPAMLCRPHIGRIGRL